MADNREDRPDARKIARDAGNEIGEALIRAGQAAGTALLRVGELAGDALSGFFGDGGTGGKLRSHVVPELAPLHPMSPGDEVETRVRVVNEADGASKPFALTATELTSDAGDAIPAEAVVLPSHQRVVAGHLSDSVPLTVKVPADAKPGLYRGELRADGDGVGAVALVFEVR